MSRFHVGQMVVCVDNYGAEQEFVLRRVYEVERVGPGCCGTLRLDLVGATKAFSTNNPAWNAERFRPAKDTSIEIFRKLVAPMPFSAWQTGERVKTVAALFVESGGIYSGLAGVDIWDRERDARYYVGPYPVICHPPCERWGRYWGGSPRKPHQYTLGDDGGCFTAALDAVTLWGGVLEHPEGSHAWPRFGLDKPPRNGGWIATGRGWTCCVEQGHYGHLSRKATWLYAVNTNRPELTWGRSEQRIHPVALAKYGYEKARRIGVMAMVGGKDKTRIRNATPPLFRDLLLSMARSVTANATAPKSVPSLSPTPARGASSPESSLPE